MADVSALLPYGVVKTLSRVRRRVEPALRRVLGGGRPSWTREPNTLPWFDQPDALARIPADDPQAALLRQWVEEGWCVVDDVVDPADIDAMVAALDGLWDAPAPVPHLDLLDLREAPDASPRTVSHAELLAMDPARRARMRACSDWRIHGFHYLNAPARRLFDSPTLLALTTRLFGRPARPFAVINFMKGSRQHLHQDMGVFHIYPWNHLIGAWIACEDISPDSGPLVFYPGSHRAEFFPGFAAYPQTNLRTADEALAAAYDAYVADVATAYPRREFLPRKGQVLLWHGMLVHGGAPVARPGTSRKSMVIHYTVPGADRAKEIQGPVRW
jgi:ectoine hydroxylase-related dioxygenase (phytanoyl-CoA dioxygenase family)